MYRAHVHDNGEKENTKKREKKKVYTSILTWYVTGKGVNGSYSYF